MAGGFSGAIEKYRETARDEFPGGINAGSDHPPPPVSDGHT